MVPLFNNYIANNMEGRGHFHAKICFARGRVWPFKMVIFQKSILYSWWKRKQEISTTPRKTNGWRLNILGCLVNRVFM